MNKCEFYEFTTMYSFARHSLQKQSYQEFYTNLLRTHTVYSPITHNQFVIEEKWLQLGRPYYNIWPGICQPLIKLDLNKVPCELIQLPLSVLAFRMAKEKYSIGFEIDGVKHELQSALAHIHAEDDARALLLFMDFGERDPVPVFNYVKMKLGKNENLGQSFDSVPIRESAKIGWNIESNLTRQVLQLVTSCCLLAKDGEDSLLEPDVFAADREKFEQTQDMKYFEKAKRRGKFGWNVGIKCEVSPHWRRAHPALYYTGHGGEVPKIIMRRGSMVHKEIIKQMPTGFESTQENSADSKSSDK